MRTELMQQFRSCISTEGDTGMLIAADAMQESSEPDNQRLGELLRLYVEIQTFVRMSMPVPAEKSNRFIELNNSFEVPISDYVGNYTERYSNQLGPFYTAFAADASALANNLHWIESEPIRQLNIVNADVNKDLAMIMRNHRMEYMTNLTIHFKWRERRQEAEIAKCVMQLAGASLRELTLMSVSNKMKMIPAMFIANPKIAKGCALIIQRDRVAVRK